MLNTNNTRLSDSSLTASYDNSNAASKWFGYGNYYNWYSATAGNGTYGFSINNKSVTGDLCPAGWHLPKGGNKNNTANSEFWALSLAIVGAEPANTPDQTYPKSQETQKVITLLMLLELTQTTLFTPGTGMMPRRAVVAAMAAIGRLLLAVATTPTAWASLVTASSPGRVATTSIAGIQSAA